MNELIRDELAPNGVLRAAINLSNFLLVSGKLPDGTPDGISPDMAKQVAAKIGVPVKLITYDRPGLVADAAAHNKWDIGNIAAELKRAEIIDFSTPYVVIDANFLTQKSSHLNCNSDINSSGVRIVVSERSAYDLWLTENFKNAEIIRANSIQDSHDIFLRGGVDVLASLKPKLLEEIVLNNDLRMIEIPFTSINQSIGVKKHSPNAIAFLNDLIEELVENGFISTSLKKHGVDQKLSIPNLNQLSEGGTKKAK